MQEVVILSGIGDGSPSLDGNQAVIKLQAAQDNIKNLWARAWDLHSVAVAQAVAAISRKDNAGYSHAKDMKTEADRWKKRAAEEMAENDTLRGQLGGQLSDKISLTSAAAQWFNEPAGLSVPQRYLASAGGTPIPIFPAYA